MGAQLSMNCQKDYLFVAKPPKRMDFYWLTIDFFIPNITLLVQCVFHKVLDSRSLE